MTLAIAAACAAILAAFTVARPRSQPPTKAAPPDHTLPYTHATRSAADAVRAFAAVGIRLERRSVSPAGTDLADRRHLFEVDAFADADRVVASGFSDSTVDLATGNLVPFARNCSGDGRNAERWRRNIRVVLDCRRAGAQAPA